jgi:hypothetical protein
LSVQDRIAEEVRAFQVLDLEALRAEWRRLYGPPPKLRSPDLLRQIMAWRMQAERLGGLSATVKRAVHSTGAARDPKAGLGLGATLSREWQGRRYDVSTTGSGFLFEGKTYRSLSEVARVITGVRWNGPRFFGLREPSGA